MIALKFTQKGGDNKYYGCVFPENNLKKLKLDWNEVIHRDRGRTNGPLDQKTKKPTVESFLNFFRSIIGRGSGFRFERPAEFSRNKA
jgi:hypothetical protein